MHWTYLINSIGAKPARDVNRIYLIELDKAKLELTEGTRGY